MNTFELSLDLDKRSTLQGITIRRGDSDGTTVRASIFDHGSVANLTGATAYLVMRLPDGLHYYRKAATVGTGTVTATINEEEAASAVGSTKLAYFEISQGGSEYSTSSFAVKVLNDAVAGMNPPESYDDEIAQLVDDWLVAHPEATTTVQDGSITTAKIADANVTTAKLAANAVTTDRIVDANVTTAKLANSSVTTAKIADSNVTTAKVANSAIVTAKIADANVTTAKVADGAITHDKLAEGVTDVIDSVPTIQRNVDRLLGNILTGKLTEAAVLTANDAYAAPPKGVDVYGKSVQDGTPTPDAPVAIQSVDNLTLNMCGKNLWPTVATQTVNGVTFTANADGSVTLNGTATATINQGTIFTVPQTGTYRMSGCPSGGGASTYQLWSYNIVGTSRSLIDTGSGDTNTLPQGLIVSLRIRVQSGYTCNNVVIRPMLAFGSAVHEFMPYTGTTIPIPFSNNIARSLPDGTRDELTLSYIGPSETAGYGVYSAELVQRVGAATYDGSSDESWDASNIPFVPLGVDAVNAIGLCDHATQSGATEVGTFNIYKSSSYPSRFYFNIAGSGAMTVEQVKTWLAENPTTVLFKLVETVTHDLGTVELPVNPAPDLTAWADGGSAQPTMSMEYERDVNIALVMERDKAMAEIAPLETSPTKANHSVGTYLMYDGTLYKVTRAIASGEQITPGTNATATTVAAELLALA